MDCKTARVLLDYQRPGELPPEEAADLERHLGSCVECDGAARAEQRLDAHFGRAIREVPLPAQLRERLLSRLKEERAAVLRHRLAWTARGVAVAAALLLGVFLWWHFTVAKPQRLDPGYLVEEDYKKTRSPSPEKVETWFQEHHKLAMVAPRMFSYDYLVDYDLTSFQGKWVPKLIFQREQNKDFGFVRARVYVLTAAQFDLPALLADLPGDPPEFQSWERKLTVRDAQQAPNTKYLIIYDGDDLRALEPPPNPAI
jgi:hypothetical protein